ncbi:MAG TPA: hypothetical protein VFM97_00050 [Gammaproteobacteria bacterium]|nr:hypothetical protein [Gammaproteobacteria bacterium]
MVNGVHSYQPAIDIQWTKIVKYSAGVSKRYAGLSRMNLSPYLGDSGAVTVTKNIRQDTGSFTFTLTDQVNSRIKDTLYAALAPMDYIEIRLSREPFRYPQRLPIAMRGFITSVKRTEIMGGDGRPVRAVTVQGQDYGKLLGILQIFYEQNYFLKQNLLTVFRLSSNFNIDYQVYQASDFIRTVLDRIVNPFLKTMWHASALASADSNPFQIEPQTSVTEGTIQPYSIQDYAGNLWGLLKKFSDIYWNELFIRDDEDAVRLVYRPLPYQDIAGNWIATASDPGSTTITLADVMEWDVSRSDVDIANYFWVNAPRYVLNSGGMLKVAAYNNEQDYFLENTDKHPHAAANCDPDLYGIRKMEVNTEQGATESETSGTNLPKNVLIKENGLEQKWCKQRRDELVALNKDNGVFESGTLILKGNEAIKPGTYLRIDFGTYRTAYYIIGVTHTYVPLESFKTTVSVIRGTGFIEREKAALSPYFAERPEPIYG